MKLSKVIMIIVALVVIAGAYVFWSINIDQAPSITQLTSTQTANDNSLYERLVVNSDLPPEGTRSLFDHLVAQNESLPYPFENLLALLSSHHPDGQAPITLLIPHGRSLLKGQTNHQLPRIVAAADFQADNTPAALGLSTQGQLFLGFVEAANEIEVLSYNEAAGRFEFQLVQNYCEGCVPRIVYARRAVCLTCHQGAGAPIFPQRPWNETNGQLAVSTAIRDARSSDQPYRSAPIKQPLAAAERFDELTDIGNFYIVSQRVWLDACGENGTECRRSLLALALRYAFQPGLFDPESVEVEALKALWEASYPAQGIEVAESDLQNRNPEGEYESLSDWLYGIFTTEIKFGDGAKDNEDLSAFESLPPLPPVLDPLTSRQPKDILFKQDIDGIYGLARFFTDADIQSLKQQYGYHFDPILNKLNQLPDKVFEAKPFSRVAMMNHLLDASILYCCLNTDAMSPAQASGVPELEITKHPQLQHFEQYCFACHRGNPAKRLDFMAGSDEDEVLKNIEAKSEIRETLDWERYQGGLQASKVMPPSDSIQYRKLLEAGENVRQEMRDTVPSLFSF